MRERVAWVDAGGALFARLSWALEPRGWRLERVQPGPDPGGLRGAEPSVANVDEPPPALILEFPAGGRGAELMRLALRWRPRPGLVALCPAGLVEAGVEALKEGADEFLLGPFDADELDLKLERALEIRRLRGADSGQSRHSPPGLRRITGESPAIRQVRRQVERVAPGRATVLITGETGTGKELVANAIHALSPRCVRPFVKVNCAALPDSLLESELFGHERGAFTGAEQRRIGRFEEADGGTLLLDEVGDMHLRTQAKVLRVLQEQEFERLGGTRPVRVDVRIIAATNQDLAARIAAGSFREDLFFRLHVIVIQLPPLRERLEDVPLLAGDFLREFNAELPRSKRGFTPEALTAMKGAVWRGNVRELRNAIERGVLMGETEWVGPADLGLGPPPAAAAAGAPLVRLPEEGAALREIERQAILQALERVSFVQKDAARLLRVSRRKLNYRIRRLGITHPSWRRNRPGSRAGR